MMHTRAERKMLPCRQPARGAAARSASLEKEGAPSRKEIISYVEAVTDKNSEYYIPPKDRIAVSDMDGTLFCETDPTYFDFKLLMYRVLEDEVYRERVLEDEVYREQATEEERIVVKKIQDYINTGELAEGLEYDAGQAIASTFSGMTVTEFGQYVRQFGELPAPGYDGMKAGEAFYRPMVQILSYLRKNGFSVYVCSGTDRMVVREIVSGVNIRVIQRMRSTILTIMTNWFWEERC